MFHQNKAFKTLSFCVSVSMRWKDCVSELWKNWVNKEYENVKLKK